MGWILVILVTCLQRKMIKKYIYKDKKTNVKKAIPKVEDIGINIFKKKV